MNRNIERIVSNLEELSNACNTFELYSDALYEAKELMEQCNDTVFCVECKNRYTDHCPVRNSKDHTDDDWYCADGERW